MAQRIEAISPTPSRHSKYPWEEWADGGVWLLRRGEDFDCLARNMRAQAAVYAYRNNLTLTSHVHEDELEVQFLTRHG